MRLEDAFGATLRELRTEKGLSQDVLASLSDLDRTYISLLERGLRQPSLATIFQVAKALDTQPDTLVHQVAKRQRSVK